MQSAKACGIAFGLAKWGAKNIENFQSVDIIIDSPQEILDLLENRQRA